jgi:hypothetical protein
MSSSLSEKVTRRLSGVRKRKRAQKGFASSVLIAKMQLVPTSDDKKVRVQKKDEAGAD